VRRPREEQGLGPAAYIGVKKMAEFVYAASTIKEINHD